MTEIHDGEQSVETKRALSTHRGPIIVYFLYLWPSLSQRKTMLPNGTETTEFEKMKRPCQANGGDLTKGLHCAKMVVVAEALKPALIVVEQRSRQHSRTRRQPRPCFRAPRSWRFLYAGNQKGACG